MLSPSSVNGWRNVWPGHTASSALTLVATAFGAATTASAALGASAAFAAAGMYSAITSATDAPATHATVLTILLAVWRNEDILSSVTPLAAELSQG